MRYSCNADYRQSVSVETNERSILLRSTEGSAEDLFIKLIVVTADAAKLLVLTASHLIFTS